MRNAFSQALVAAAKSDPRFMLLTGDHGYALFDEFRRECPEQYINAGVAEQNMVGVAAGLAKAGCRPVVYGLSAFVPMRVLEQIKLDVCYEQLPVTFIGDGAGVVYSSLGSSHQCTEDIAALRAMPDLTILSPADAHEMEACLALAFDSAGPVYVRMGKADLGTVHATSVPFQPGQLLPVRAGTGGVSWIATGSMVRSAMALASQFPGGAVWSAPCLKPLDSDLVTEICRGAEVVAVLEEHSIYGGLASAIAEIAAAKQPVHIASLGIRDRFSKFCGDYEYLKREHQISNDALAIRLKQFLAEIRLAGSVSRQPRIRVA